jgi:predicted nuclease with TOPRIM domain
MREDLNQTLDALRREAEEADTELRRRRGAMHKSRQRYQALLDAVGLTEEEIALALRENLLHPEAYDMMRKAMDETRRAEAEGHEAETPAPEAAKRKKRMIVKL